MISLRLTTRMRTTTNVNKAGNAGTLTRVKYTLFFPSGALITHVSTQNAILRPMKKSPIQVLHFALHDEFIDLHNLLKVTGVADSGAAGKALVATGVVTVDSAQELRKSAKIRAGQLVKLPGVSIHVHQSDTPRPPKPVKPPKAPKPTSMPAAQAIMATVFPGMEPPTKLRAKPRARSAGVAPSAGKMVTAKRPSRKPKTRSKHHA